MDSFKEVLQGTVEIAPRWATLVQWDQRGIWSPCGVVPLTSTIPQAFLVWRGLSENKTQLVLGKLGVQGMNRARPECGLWQCVDHCWLLGSYTACYCTHVLSFQLCNIWCPWKVNPEQRVLCCCSLGCSYCAETVTQCTNLSNRSNFPQKAVLLEGLLCLSVSAQALAIYFLVVSTTHSLSFRVFFCGFRSNLAEVRAAYPMGCSQHLFHINHSLL